MAKLVRESLGGFPEGDPRHNLSHEDMADQVSGAVYITFNGDDVEFEGLDWDEIQKWTDEFNNEFGIDIPPEELEPLGDFDNARAADPETIKSLWFKMHNDGWI